MIQDVKTNELYSFRFWGVFMVLSLLYVVLYYITNTYVYTGDFYETLLRGTIDEARISKTIEMRQHFLWISYIAQPLLLLMRCTVFSGAIYTGAMLSGPVIEYRNCLRIVMLAEMVTFLSTLIKITCFLVLPSLSPKSFQYFFPLSITQLLNLDAVPKYFIYPLSQLNLFEVVYWILLAMGVKYFSQQSWGHALKIVASTYGALLLVWILVIVFISLQFS
jgi:hypothetical protein